MNTSNPALALLLLCALIPAARAAPNDGIVGVYARVEVGRSQFGLSSASPRLAADDSGQAAKLFGGYRFESGLGFELGYAALGRFSETVAVGGASAQQEAKGRSVFAVATARWPLGESLAWHGRLGLSAGRVSGDSVVPPADRLSGRKTSALIGLGAEYRPRSNVALTLNFDHYGQLSDHVRARALVFGLHFTL